MDDIEPLLVRWGIWSSQKENNGLGYPRKCPTFKLEASGSGDTPQHFLPVDDAILHIDRIISGLENSQPELKRLAVLMYVKAFPVSSIARLERVTDWTVYKRKKKLLDILAREYHKAA